MGRKPKRFRPSRKKLPPRSRPPTGPRRKLLSSRLFGPRAVVTALMLQGQIAVTQAFGRDTIFARDLTPVFPVEIKPGVTVKRFVYMSEFDAVGLCQRFAI